MRKFFIALNLILLTSVVIFAQNEESTGSILLESGTSIEAKLLGTLDAKNTEVGDEVILKTTKSIKQNGEVVVPKGTKLIGRVTEVQEKTKKDKTSKISMVFESLQNKNLSAPVNATIVSIVNTGGKTRAGDLIGAETSGSSRTTGKVSSKGNSGGDLLGGTTNTVGGVLNTTTNTVGGVTNTVGNTASGATNTLGRTINGIRISQTLDASAQGSTTLSAENKNVRLEKGTMFQLRLNESIGN